MGLFSKKQPENNYHNMLIDSYMQSGRIKQQFDGEFAISLGNKAVKIISYIVFISIFVLGIIYIF
ncbi:hypothetical protein AAEX28_11550 [Lentisphaerota bacterium WC36G]|nr:hypothetical protein LJT99_14385 [Lentisphaerae bacterium WC36]